VTNGKRVFAIGGDGRGAWTRRWKDLHEQHVLDIGGPEGLSEAQVSLCRRCAAIEVQLEQMEAQMSEGNLDVDLDLYGRLTGQLRRTFEAAAKAVLWPSWARTWPLARTTAQFWRVASAGRFKSLRRALICDRGV
jgi:hypothetical protein